MQPVTAAVSPAGITYLLQTLLGSQIAKALEQHMTLPDYPLPMADFISTTYAGTIEYSNIKINLSGGTFKNFTPTFGGMAQSTANASQFLVTMVANDVEIDYSWIEEYDYEVIITSRTEPAQGGGHAAAKDAAGLGDGHFGPTTYPYSLSIPKLTITAIFQLSVTNGGYRLSYSNSSVDPGSPHPNIPSDSVVNDQENYDCGFATRISDATKTQLDAIDFGSCAAQALAPIFASIADSGKLGPVEFDFLKPGDSGLVFPSGGGIQIGATGRVSVNGSAFAAPSPADLPLPPIPTGNPPPHVAYYIQDYEVNALFWGFQAAGVLQATITSGEIADPQALETNTYAGGSLNNLAMKYPGLLMTAGLAAREAPTVRFCTVYQFTGKSLAKIQAALGPAVWASYGDEIKELNGQCFSTQAGLEAELALIDPALSEYAPVIEQNTAMAGAVVDHTTRCVLNVLARGAPVPVIIFDVAQCFVMEGLQLGHSSQGTAQSVIFTFAQAMDKLPVASFVSSTIPGVNGGSFGDVWNALRTNWQVTFAAIGTAGMPLPHIPGFDFVFGNAPVTVVPPLAGSDGYISVSASVTYVPEKLAAPVRAKLARPVVAAA